MWGLLRELAAAQLVLSAASDARVRDRDHDRSCGSVRRSRCAWTIRWPGRRTAPVTCASAWNGCVTGTTNDNDYSICVEYVSQLELPIIVLDTDGLGHNTNDMEMIHTFMNITHTFCTDANDHIRNLPLLPIVLRNANTATAASATIHSATTAGAAAALAATLCSTAALGDHEAAIATTRSLAATLPVALAVVATAAARVQAFQTNGRMDDRR